jgi:DNA-binding IclR family transcriptional regulator
MTKVIGSLDRGIRILDMLGSASEPLGVTDIARVLEVDKSTAYRLLLTLQARGYVQQLDTKKYRLGCRCIHLGSAALNAIDIRAEAATYLEELAQRTGKTVHFTVLAGDEGIYVDRVQGQSVIAISTQVGSEAPMHCTASGKAILAFRDSRKVRAWLNQHDLAQFTPNTITDVDRLWEHLQTVREEGCAVDNEERFEGVRCVAAPVFNHNGQVAASLGVSGASSQMNSAQIEQAKEAVKEVASRLSARLGYREPVLAT